MNTTASPTMSGRTMGCSVGSGDGGYLRCQVRIESGLQGFMSGGFMFAVPVWVVIPVLLLLVLGGVKLVKFLLMALKG